MVATCALFFSACSNVESDGAYADQTGSISIDLGSSTRGLVTFDSTTVTWYKLEVTGNGKTYKDEGAPGSKIKFENLSIGVYTVLCEAYMGEAKIQIATAEANVVAGETADVVLKFKKENLLSTKFMMMNGFKHKVYDSIKDIPSDFGIDEDIADFKSISYAEDKKGDIYYLDAGNVKCKGNGDFSIHNESIGEDHNVKLYYDAVSEVLYLFNNFNSAGQLFKVNLVEREIENIGSIEAGQIDNNLLSGYKGFCVEGNKFFLYGEEVEYPEGEQMKFCAIYYGTIDVEQKSITQVSKMKVNDIFGDQYKNAQITDMVIIEKGKILMLLSQNLPSFMSNQITIDNYTGNGTIYSRGAIAELSYDNNGFIKNKIGGWFDDSKKRTLTQNGEKPLQGKETLKNVDIYGPSKAQRKDYFCGPKRIVCIRPKEVYIVDEGVNIRLADWTKRHDGCRDYESDVALGQYDPDGVSYGHIGRSGNLFRVSRIVKVNLDTFAMNTEKEAVVPLFKISATETGGQARYSSSFNSNDFIFSSISVSGSSDNLGYVECPITGYLGIHPFMEEDEE